MNSLFRSRREAAIAAASATAILVIVLGILNANGAPSSQLPFGATYQQLPAGLAHFGDTQLTPLTATEVAAVTVGPTAALSAAENFIGVSSSANVTQTTSLGAFTDTGYKQASSGGYHLVASNLPAYVVSFSGLSIPVMMGSGVVTHESVIVNAITGVVVEGIKFC